MEKEALIADFIKRTIDGLQNKDVYLGIENGGKYRLSYEGSPYNLYYNHPSFYGCYDWHSSVHSHWQLLRIIRKYFMNEHIYTIVHLLDKHFAPERIEGELNYVKKHPNYEIPYGMSWFLTLGMELKEWDKKMPNNAPSRWLKNIQPFLTHARNALVNYYKITSSPITDGQHENTAFSLGLAHDYATTFDDKEFLALITEKATTFYSQSVNAIFFTGSRDFLSADLCVADLMRRVYTKEEFEIWLAKFIPTPEILNEKLQPIQYETNIESHLVGLNITRAWMLDDIASVLPDTNPRKAIMTKLEKSNFEVGKDPAANNRDWMIVHWCPTLLVYYFTERGKKPKQPNHSNNNGLNFLA